MSKYRCSILVFNMSNFNVTIQQRAETQYWIIIMIKSNLVSEQKFSLMQQEIIEIIKILTATLNTLKSK